VSQGITCKRTLFFGLIALGGNLPSPVGDPLETINDAISKLSHQFGSLSAVSRRFSTPCMPKGAGPDYVNAAVGLWTNDTAEEVLAKLHQLESQYDRKRTNRWGARTLDLDLLDLGGMVSPNRQTYEQWATLDDPQKIARTPEQLILPHPRIAERGFVLKPLMDIAPDWTHPTTGRSVKQMLATLDSAEVLEIRAIDSTDLLPIATVATR
jgi:2-amino-4-hydroxy-6-hydroxymethyldihydropteridine diphosphokinase